MQSNGSSPPRAAMPWSGRGDSGRGGRGAFFRSRSYLSEQLPIEITLRAEPLDFTSRGYCAAIDSAAGGTPSHPNQSPMTVEILEFQLVPGRRDEFIDRNERVWTPALRQRPGFIQREVLASSEEPDSVAIIIHWRSRSDIDAFPREEQAKLDERMGDLARPRKRRVYEQLIAP